MRTMSLTKRILSQLRHDRRTMALVLFAPLLSLSLLYFILSGTGATYTVVVGDAPKAIVDDLRDQDELSLRIVDVDGKKWRAPKSGAESDPDTVKETVVEQEAVCGVIIPDDMKEILLSETEFVGVCKPSTDDPVLVGIKDNKVTNFYQENGPYEWTGVTMLESRKLTPTDGHVLHLVEQVLPLGYKIIREREIDTPNDYKNAIIWVENGYKD